MKRKNVYWQNLFYELTYKAISSPLPEIFFVAALVMSRHQSGIYFNYTTQIGLPVLLLGFLASLAYFGYRIVFGMGSTSHLAALLFAYGLYGYYTINSPVSHSLFPHISTQAVNFNVVVSTAIIIGLAATAGLVAWAVRILLARFSVLKNLRAYKILFAAVALVFVVEVVLFFNRYLQLH